MQFIMGNVNQKMYTDNKGDQNWTHAWMPHGYCSENYANVLKQSCLQWVNLKQKVFICKERSKCLLFTMNEKAVTTTPPEFNFFHRWTKPFESSLFYGYWKHHIIRAMILMQYETNVYPSKVDNKLDATFLSPTLKLLLKVLVGLLVGKFQS